jgi:Peptidase propeptide and YPEB domain
MNRRIAMLGLLLACVAQAVEPAYADGGSGSSGSGGSGSSGSGGGGSGSGNSGGASDDNGDDNDDDDWNSAATAVEQGDILPLPSVLKIALADTPGKVIGVKLDRKGASYVYRVKILAKTGRKVELAIDARSKALIKVQ